MAEAVAATFAGKEENLVAVLDASGFSPYLLCTRLSMRIHLVEADVSPDTVRRVREALLRRIGELCAESGTPGWASALEPVDHSAEPPPQGGAPECPARSQVGPGEGHHP